MKARKAHHDDMVRRAWRRLIFYSVSAWAKGRSFVVCHRSLALTLFCPALGWQWIKQASLRLGLWLSSTTNLLEEWRVVHMVKEKAEGAEFSVAGTHGQQSWIAAVGMKEFHCSASWFQGESNWLARLSQRAIAPRLCSVGSGDFLQQHHAVITCRRGKGSTQTKLDDYNAVIN